MPTIWKAEDIYNCKSHSSMNYSPVKNEMLYVLNAMNRDENRYVCSIVKHDLEIGNVRAAAARAVATRWPSASAPIRPT